MARETEKLEDWVTYVPDVDDNRSDPNPLTVEIHPMSAEEFRSFQRGIVSGKQKASAQMARSQKAVGRILAERVRNVRGYKCDGRVITTGAELYAYGEPVVYDDVFDAILNMSTLKEGLLGKSNSRSASLQAATATPGLGAAPSARATPPATTFAPHATATASPQPSASIGLPSSSDAPGLS